MGNNANKQVVDYRSLMSRFDVVQELYEQNIKFLEEKETKQEYLLKQITFNDKNQFNKVVAALTQKKTKLMNNPHVVPLTEFIVRSQDQFCSTFYKIYALFEYPIRTLEDEINERQLQKRKFAEKQIWSILASCILGLSHLQKNNIKHQSLKSSSILLASSGVIKISDPAYISLSTNYYALLSKRTTPHIYLSPQQCEALANQQLSPPSTSNSYKSDVFTLGLIMLQTGLLQYQDQCYRDQGSRVHWETIKYNLERFGQVYTSELKTMIELMLQKEEKERPEWIELEAYVKKGDDRELQQNYNSVKNVTYIPEVVNFSSQPNQYPMVQNRPPSLPNTITWDLLPIKHNVFDPLKYFKTVNLPNTYTTKTSNDENLIQVEDQPTQESPSQNQQQQPALSLPLNTFTYQPPRQSSDYQSNYNTFKPTVLPANTIREPINIVNNFNNYRPGNLQSHYISNRPTNSIYYQQTTVLSNNFQHQQLNSPSFLQNNYLIKGVTPKFVTNQPTFASSYATNLSSTVTNAPITFNTQPYESKPYEKITNNNPKVIVADKPFSDPQKQEVKFVIETFKQGSKYEGEKYNGMRHGKGKFYYQDGGLYDGQWKENKMCGYGKLYYQSKKIAYEGMWNNDQFTGFGILYNETPIILHQPFDYRNLEQVDEFWTKFEGNFSDDLKEGKGKLFFSNGEYFQGIFEKDLATGKGQFYTMTGVIVRGEWQNNKLIRIV